MPGSRPLPRGPVADLHGIPDPYTERVPANVSVRPRTVLCPGARFCAPATASFTETNSLRAIHAGMAQRDTARQAQRRGRTPTSAALPERVRPPRVARWVPLLGGG